jgi:hypothetical protein
VQTIKDTIGIQTTMASTIALASLFASIVRAQQVGTLTAEVHPALTWQTCTTGGTCKCIPQKHNSLSQKCHVLGYIPRRVLGAPEFFPR